VDDVVAEAFWTEVAGIRAELLDTFGHAATWTKQSSGVTTAVTLWFRQDGTSGEAGIESSELATPPLKDDSFVITGATTRWYVREVRNREGHTAGYVLDVSSNATE
jgi:hypothetical protein